MRILVLFTLSIFGLAVGLAALCVVLFVTFLMALWVAKIWVLVFGSVFSALGNKFKFARKVADKIDTWEEFLDDIEYSVYNA